MTTVNIEGFGEASIHFCTSKAEQLRLLETMRKVKIYTPQAVFYISEKNEPEITGAMISVCSEIPIYSGGELQSFRDILYYSMGFHLELYTPAEFAA